MSVVKLPKDTPLKMCHVLCTPELSSLTGKWELPGKESGKEDGHGSHAYNPSIRSGEMGGSLLYASLIYIVRPCLGKRNEGWGWESWEGGFEREMVAGLGRVSWYSTESESEYCQMLGKWKAWAWGLAFRISSRSGIWTRCKGCKSLVNWK